MHSTFSIWKDDGYIVFGCILGLLCSHDMIHTGKELEAAGVLNGAQQRFEENGLWNSPVPFVAPDGWLVPYAWKRQIAGQAAATAYERARYGYILGVILV